MKFRLLATICVLFPVITQATIDDLRITEVDPIGNRVEVTHFGNQAFTNSATRAFCHRFSYSPSMPVGEVFLPGESKVYTVSLDDAVSDIWLYRSTSGFANPANMITGMKYGSGAPVGRETVAVSAGLWSAAGAFVPAPNGNQSLQLRDFDAGQPANWVSAHPTLGAFFVLSDVVADIPASEITIGLQMVATGLASPLGVHAPRDGSGRLFILDQVGKVWIVKDGLTLPTPMLDVTSQLVSLNAGYDERGLLGMALHPDFARNGRLYTYQSEPVSGTPDFTSGGPANHHSVIAEWRIDTGNPDRVDSGSKRVLIRANQPQSNHNGGDLAFGPDGYLYIAFGDGGGSDDSAAGHGALGNGQDAANVYGAILRIDVEGSDSLNGQYGIPTNNPFAASAELDEIYAYGFRNPYRISFDSLSGELYTGDVGQNHVEEVDRVERGGNYGWRFKEGSFFFNHNPSGGGYVTSVPVDPAPTRAVTDPIAEYDHGDGISVIGGYVYRGSALPMLQGRYVFGEFGSSFSFPSGFLLMLDQDHAIHRLRLGLDARGLDLWIKGFGQDETGEIYVCGSRSLGPAGVTGHVWKLIPLVHVNAMAVGESVVAIDVIHDESVTDLQAESATHLTDPADWTKVNATLTPLGPGSQRATLAAPDVDTRAYRIVGSD